MGSGIEAARLAAPEHAAAMDNMKDQLLLVLIDRLGGKVSIPVGEIDSTGGKVLSLRYDAATHAFEFVLGRKQ